ncbi:sec-independent protein translocase protein TatB [Roseovarius azorensis]|uniref:Sec-independent protein translocase protein TatB n=1 Tax=Roseovarius azorensis TaxID=1287727 RepID=A0A1H7LVH9_9RHOB|nr:Sec-independent protein translocase protein TatB [Roseovarius azorensis]SEL02902.1 sec-independent protein translocase protein TatB [Roseovarius azorensis]
MFDLGWTELLLIGIVALIVVGPKDLPGMFRAVGKFIGKAKGMAREFSRAMNDAADQSGVNDITNTFKKASNPMKSAMDEVRKTTDSVTRDLKDSAKPALSEERQAQADKIREKAADMASARKTAEAEAAVAAPGDKAATTASAPKPKAAPKSKAKARAKAKDQA